MALDWNLDSILVVPLGGARWRQQQQRYQIGSVTPCIYSAHYLLFALITIPLLSPVARYFTPRP